MEKGKECRKPLKDAPEYEIVFLPTGRVWECLMGLWDGKAKCWALERIYSNLAEDRIWLADGTFRLLLHTTRRLESGGYRYGCYEPGGGWRAGGEHLHMERLLPHTECAENAETFWLWVYDACERRNYYHHRIYDGRDRLIGSFDSFHETAQPYEEIDYGLKEGHMLFWLKQDGRQLFDQSFM